MSDSPKTKNSRPSAAKGPGTAVAGASAEVAARQRRSAAVIAFLLVIITAVVYDSVLRNDFVSYDDDQYVTENPRVRQGMSWENVRWAFTTFYASNWHPLTWISHLLDVRLFGLNPAGHHFTNLLFHILTTLLLFGFLRFTTGRLWPGALVAGLFALHPLHVESVAWVAERKDVLSTFFWLATLWAYAYYARRPGAGRYATVAFLFALGLMAKPMLVTLPLTLLLLDYWPFERLSPHLRSVGQLAIEKLPLLIMSAASAILTIIAQQGAIGGFSRLNLATRLSNAAISYCIYIGQAFWPAGLAVFYPHPAQPFPLEAIAGTVLLIVVTVAVLRAGKQKKYLTTGWLWYLVTLAPVIGIVQAGDQAHADRYTYVPFIGIFIMIAWGLTTIADRLHNSKKLFVKIAVAALFAAMIGMTWEQVGYWKNSITLFSHAVAVTKRNYIAYNKLGRVMDQMGRMDEAIANYRSALEINPNDGEANNNLGILLARSGRPDEAIAHFQMVVQLNPNDGEANNNLGLLLMKLGRTDEAIAHYRKSLEVNPDKIGTLPNLAFALVQKGQLTDAIPLLQRALALAKSAGDEAEAKTMAQILERLYEEARETGHSSPVPPKAPEQP